jgi:hypothetical protein
MYLNLTEAGRRINKSRTIVGKLIDDGFLDGYVDPRSGRRCVLESDIAEYLASFQLYKRPQEPQEPQPLEKIG